MLSLSLYIYLKLKKKKKKRYILSHSDPDPTSTTVKIHIVTIFCGSYNKLPNDNYQALSCYRRYPVASIKWIPHFEGILQNADNSRL